MEVAWENLGGRKRCWRLCGFSPSRHRRRARSDSQAAIRHPTGVKNVIDVRRVPLLTLDGHSRRNRDSGIGLIARRRRRHRGRPDFYFAAEEKHVLPTAAAAAASGSCRLRLSPSNVLIVNMQVEYYSSLHAFSRHLLSITLLHNIFP